ncbi:hypothetical protein AMECASPLE_012069 [Ameca splendens]|uniref:Secreted protein n=1 Tax=Ameca splendens TaxID=208324 RepID=A0ABV0ZBJ7_9TELE
MFCRHRGGALADLMTSSLVWVVLCWKWCSNKNSLMLASLNKQMREPVRRCANEVSLEMGEKNAETHTFFSRGASKMLCKRWPERGGGTNNVGVTLE